MDWRKDYTSRQGTLILWLIPNPENMLTSLTQNEVRQRYLFAIEDPFEIDHNVARPVTHGGIVAIRDEFRRAWRILQRIGEGHIPEDDFLAAMEDVAPTKEPTPVEAEGVLEAAATGPGQNTTKADLLAV